MKYALACCLVLTTALTPAYVSAQAPDRVSLSSDIAAIEGQILAAEGEKAKFSGGAIVALIDARIQTLLLNKSVLELQLSALGGGAQPKVIDLPAVMPDAKLAGEILVEIAAQEKKVVYLQKEAEGMGGLVQGLKLMEAQTEQMNLAMLRGAWYRAQYGAIAPEVVAMGERTGTSAPPVTQTASPVAGAQLEVPAWADPAHPEINYDIPAIRGLAEDGYQFSGYFAIQKGKAAIDDTPQVSAINIALAEAKGFQPFIKTLNIGCREGEASVIYRADSYVMGDFNTHRLPVTYRVDEQSPVTSNWNQITSNEGVGLFGAAAEEFSQKLYKANKMFVRLQEKNGKNHDAEFPLAGVKQAVEAVSQACSFSLISLSQAEYKAIQTLLNAAGYNTGTPDGVWGQASKSALRRFQGSQGLPETGALDEGTLEKMGFNQ